MSDEAVDRKHLKRTSWDHRRGRRNDHGQPVHGHRHRPAGGSSKHPDATISSDSVTSTQLFNAGLTLRDAEASGRLDIHGDRSLGLALLEKLTLGAWQP